MASLTSSDSAKVQLEFFGVLHWDPKGPAGLREVLERPRLGFWDEGGVLVKRVSPDS